MEAGGNRTQALLLAGMLLGLAAAGWTIVTGERGGSLPDDAVARVNERLITREAWLRAVAAVGSERRTPLSADDQRRILERLVDEELLLQHGQDLGLVENDRRLRNQLVAEVINAAAAEAAEPDDSMLRRYYEDHREYFATPMRLRVAAATAGGAPVTPPIPDALLPATTLREYLGPRLTAVALTLAPGQARVENGVEIRVLEAAPPVVPPFEDVREQVRARARRAAEEAALRALLAELRGDGSVIVRESLE